ncbi:MarR family winged helix-turn-helix transcriptional regulator [Oceanobacillus chungangensis]|uniref:MarR family transcriptional regulator n=1 Tax=Oceanobacillus chungangensis TaxID=1229152 RepID=A0A3D8PG65_9BACI|nr:MarR family transcriptional regulator [Oceanobacillus chungangensis]RDW15076.1 MarR family transcriptional regulator [Oceanobacillus chungangensis]
MKQMEEKMNDTSLKLFVTLSKAYQSVMERAEADIKSKGLNFTDFAVLELLYHKGQQPLQKIGKKILITSGSITYIINKLEKIGYIERKPCESDKRITYASINKKGEQLLDEIFPNHWKMIRDMMSGLSEEEKEMATHLLKKLGTSIRKI